MRNGYNTDKKKRWRRVEEEEGGGKILYYTIFTAGPLLEARNGGKNDFHH